MTAKSKDRSSGFITRRRDVLRVLAAVAAGSQITLRRARRPHPPHVGAGVLRVTAGADPTSLDPMTAFSPGTDGPFLQAIYDPLIDYDFETMQPRPGLAEKWAFPTPTSLVLTLRSGIRFHDGTPMDAEAVKFNLERYLSDPRSRVKSELTSVAGVEVTGPLEVTLR
jgi:peptide/nickel transport system permease protein/peptide/nickel transport system substrate-binding protein